MKPLSFKGVYKDYLWGGNKMKEMFDVKTDISPVAESWVLSTHPDGMSVIADGEYKGMSVKDYIKNNPGVLGTNCKENDLPILIKFIDAKDNLSVQVHPDNQMAKELENQNGKTEMWYVVEAEKNAEIIYGVKENITKQKLEQAIKDNTVENLLGKSKSKKGNVYFVEAGTIHAIGAGNLIAEIQQNSNVTYRLYDYDRRDKNGDPRELHIEKGVKASNVNKTNERKIPVCSDGTRMLGSCEYFQVKEITLSDKTKSFLCDEKSYNALIQTSGESRICYNNEEFKIRAGECVFIPAGFGKYNIKGNGTVLMVANKPRYFAGVDLGGTNIAVAIVDENGVMYGRARKKTNLPRPYNEIFDDMAVCVREATENSGLSMNDIEAVGIGCPGAIDVKSGIVEFSNNLGMRNVPIVEYMEKATGKKVYVENDANAAAWGEFVTGSGKNTNNMVMVTLGTGVGSGIIIDGKLFTGAYGKGAELGHISLITGGEKCSCGKRGCFESYCSATALIRQTKDAMKKNPGSDMWRVAKGKLSNVSGVTPFSAKDKVAKDVVKTYLSYLAEGLVSITNIFQPEVICIGGGVSNQGQKIVKPLQKGIDKFSLARYGKENTKVDIASLGNDAGIIGAALLWKNS